MVATGAQYTKLDTNDHHIELTRGEQHKLI